MYLVAPRSLPPRIACVATGAVLAIPLLLGSPLGSTSMNRTSGALRPLEVELATLAERSVRTLGTSALADGVRTTQAAAGPASIPPLLPTDTAGSAVASSSFHDLLASPAGVPAGDGAARPILHAAAVDAFSQAALRVAAVSSNPIADVQAVAGVLWTLAQSIVSSLQTTPDALHTALDFLGSGDPNAAFGTLESLIITPLEFFALGDGPSVIANALTDLFPPGTPVFQTLPSVTLNVGLGVLSTYISTRTTIVNAVSDTITSLRTLNPLVIGQAIGSGIGAVTAQLLDAAFGPTGVIATLVQAGQQILGAILPPPATSSDAETVTPDAKVTVHADEPLRGSDSLVAPAGESATETASLHDGPAQDGDHHDENSSTAAVPAEGGVSTTPDATDAVPSSTGTATSATSTSTTSASADADGATTPTDHPKQAGANGSTPSDSAPTPGRSASHSGGRGDTSPSGSQSTGGGAASGTDDASPGSAHRPSGKDGTTRTTGSVGKPREAGASDAGRGADHTPGERSSSPSTSNSGEK